MVDPQELTRFLAVLFIIVAVGCTAEVKVESARSASSTDRGEAVSSESQNAEKARTEVYFDLLQSRPESTATKPPPQTPPDGKSTTTVIFNVHGGEVHFHDDKAPTPKEADGKATRTSPFNTKIGWPTTYWQHGLQACAGSLIVWLLVGIAVALMVATVRRPSGGPMWEIIGLLVAAGIVLQFLPNTDSGVQFIPISPWLYSGCLAFCLSILVWLSFIAAILVALTCCSDAPAVFSAATLFAMGINLLLSFCR